MANHREKEWEWRGKRYKAEPGQFVTSLSSIAEKSGKGISVQNVRTALKRFEKYEFLTNESTNKNRLITIINWELYQGSDDITNKQPNKQLTSNQQATNKQLTTNKNDKNDNNDNKERVAIPYQEIADTYNSICKSFPRLMKLSDARKRAIKARLNTYSLEDFKMLFTMAEESDFLKGKNDRSWSATFDWLIKDSNMAKVLDGNYKNKNKSSIAKSNSKNKFTQFDQRNYTSDQHREIERKLLNKRMEEQ